MQCLEFLPILAQNIAFEICTGFTRQSFKMGRQFLLTRCIQSFDNVHVRQYRNVKKIIFCSMKKYLIIFLCLLGVLDASAAYVAVVETGVDGVARDKVSLSDRQYLTNVLREEAVNELPAEQNYTIMTRENIIEMLPPGKAIEDCEGSCLVETGKNISADYICQARVGVFGGELTLSAELYETAGNKLLASFNGSATNLKKLLLIIRQQSPEFFRSIKKSRGFGGVGGVGNLNGVENFSYSGKKQFIVELETNPAGSLPTIDGKVNPKCPRTPCKVQIDEGSHRFVVTRDRYEDAEIVVDVKENNQKIQLSLSPNFGWLEIKPEIESSVADKGAFEVTVDGVRKNGSKIELEKGLHQVQLAHPCYDPAEFPVSIVNNKTEIFDRKLTRGKGGLNLSAEFKGEPQAVAVYIDGAKVGSTPYVGDVPLCADVVLKGENWEEQVDVQAQWHKVVQVTHKLRHSLDGDELDDDDIRSKARAAYDELDGKTNRVGEKIPSNIDVILAKMKQRWIPLSIGASVCVTGVILAIVGNSSAKDAANKGGKSIDELKKNREDAQSGQTLRSVGVAFSIIGAIGVGLSFVF